MVFSVGDILRFDSPLTDHAKYHLCVLECRPDGRAACFLLLNSKSGWQSDCVLDNAAVPCLPPSVTGKTVVSFSLVLRVSEKQLRLYRAKTIGRLEPAIARKLEDFARHVPTLSSDDRKIVMAGLAKMR